MKSDILLLNEVSFAYDSSSEPLFESRGLTIHTGWTGIVGQNGTGKTTFLQLCLGMLAPQKGVVSTPRPYGYCNQRTDEAPGGLEDFLYSYDKSALRLKGILQLEEEQGNRWDSLSHGERKRLQIGNALYERPNLLAIDEPTNHLDSQAKGVLLEALREYRGIGLIVSHDRELLDALCSHCIFLDPPSVFHLKGNYSESKAQYDATMEYNRKMFMEMRKERKRIDSIVQERRRLAEESDSRVSKKGISKKDHDSKDRINRARVTGKDGVGGKLLNQMQGRMQQAVQKQEQYKVKKEYATGIEFRTEASRRNGLYSSESDSIRFEQGKALLLPELRIGNSDRIGITGKNGSGKSTLVRRLLAGIRLEEEEILYLPQEIDAKDTLALPEKIRNVGEETLGKLMAFLTRLGSDPKRVLETKMPSPGETRKLLFALGLLKRPRLILMDEPTNHLDLLATESLEEALKDLDCALMLVSHDRIFLEKLCSIHWAIQDQGDSYRLEKSYF